MDNNNTTKTKKLFGQELDLVGIIRKMLKEKKLLCYFFFGFALFGVFNPKIYLTNRGVI